MIKLFLFFYRPLFSIGKFFLVIFRPFFGTKMQAWIDLRKSINIDFRNDGRPVFLFHASSGEIEYVKSIIRELRQAQAQITIVVSYSSPSAPRLFGNIKAEVDLFIPLPWDQPAPIKYLLDTLNPNSVFFARTDLWPEFIYQLSRRKTRTYIVAYNPSFSLTNRLAVKWFLQKFTAIFCVHPQQPELLRPMLPAAVQISLSGDTRFDQVFWRLQQPSKVKFDEALKYCVFGSTWAEDEKILILQINQIISSGFKIIWCPHEIDEKNIKSLLANENLKSLRVELFSELPTPENLDLSVLDVLIVNKIGYLADFYRQASWAFIGGSFKTKVHSVMEPICCAIPVITGPYIHNSPEALKYQRITINELPVVQVVKDSTQLAAAIQKINSTPLDNFKKLLIGNVEKNRHATRKILHFVIKKTQESLNS